jgi:hypothetical protein
MKPEIIPEKGNRLKADFPRLLTQLISDWQQ